MPYLLEVLADLFCVGFFLPACPWLGRRTAPSGMNPQCCFDCVNVPSEYPSLSVVSVQCAKVGWHVQDQLDQLLLPHLPHAGTALVCLRFHCHVPHSVGRLDYCPSVQLLHLLHCWLGLALYFIPEILLTTLRFLALFFPSCFCLIGPFNYIPLDESLPSALI